MPSCDQGGAAPDRTVYRAVTRQKRTTALVESVAEIPCKHHPMNGEAGSERGIQDGETPPAAPLSSERGRVAASRPQL
jgi:hypothetical protein